MRKIGIASLLLLIVLAAGYFGYDQLGGNNPILIQIVQKKPPHLAGKIYRGFPRDPEMGETFQTMESFLALNPGTKLHTIYYQEPAGKLDTLEVFVGLDLPFAPAELESKSFTESSYILATIRSSKWVMPGPNKVKAELEGFAKSNELILSGIFIDKIVSEGEIQVIAPIQKSKD